MTIIKFGDQSAPLTRASSYLQQLCVTIDRQVNHYLPHLFGLNGYSDVLAKLPDTVSFSVVTHEDALSFEIDELVLKKVATMVSPSVGALRLRNLFPDPMQQPRILYAMDSNDAAQMVLQRKVFCRNHSNRIGFAF